MLFSVIACLAFATLWPVLKMKLLDKSSHIPKIAS